MLEYIGPLAVMAGTSGERKRCWDYLNWLLKQKNDPRLQIDPDGRDDVLVVPIPTGKAARLQGSKGENIRSIERETSTFIVVNDVPGGERGDERLLIFGGEAKNRRRAERLCEDAADGRYAPKALDRGPGRGGSGSGRWGNDRADVCHGFQKTGKCRFGDACKFSHGAGRGGGGGRDRDRDRDRGRGGRDDSRDRGRGGPDRGDRGRGGRDDRPYARRDGDDRYDRR
jgi:hypothetical protein